MAQAELQGQGRTRRGLGSVNVSASALQDKCTGMGGGQAAQCIQRHPMEPNVLARQALWEALPHDLGHASRQSTQRSNLEATASLAEVRRDELGHRGEDLGRQRGDENTTHGPL